jgi:Subtilase family
VDRTTTLVSGVIGAGAIAAVASRRRRRTRSDEHVYMPDELLLTFVDTTAKPSHDDPRVETLLRKAIALAGDFELQPIERSRKHDNEGRPHIAGAPLTLRFKVAKPGRVSGGRDHIKKISDRINAALQSLQHEGIVVSSATPNWIVSSSRGGGATIGGPGTLPDPAPAGAWNIQVPAAGRWQPAPNPPDPAPHNPVIVAVLDSWPRPAELQAAETKAAAQVNPLMGAMAKDGAVMDCGRFDPPEGIPSTRPAIEADHGLFVCSIIHRIAPHAEIHLLHVLDDAGLGHTQLLLDALDYCLTLAHSGRRLVVNMSMYLRIPPGADLWDHWFGGSRRDSGTTLGQMAELLEALVEAVEQRLDLLLDAGAVIVAAAGNDGLLRRARRQSADGDHPQPRLPADYDGVICVVATDRNGKLAAYSNRADIPPTGNCVATYGGQGILKRGNAVVPPGGDPRDGMVGLFSQTAVPCAGAPQPNTSGWVYWSGTSFATPVISGIAANILARNELQRSSDPTVPRLTPRQVMTGILDMAEPPGLTDPALGCPYVAVTLSN